MSNFFLTPNHFLPIAKWNKYSALGAKAITSFLLFFTFLSFGPASAQTDANLIAPSKLTCNSPNRCTSKDLEIDTVRIDAPKCVTCTGETVTYPLLMTIHNGTKSERTSFALYGTLSEGAYITFNGTQYKGSVFICVGPITVKSDQLLPGEAAPGNQTFAVGSITFTCGQDLKLTNNYLAWTDAAGNTTDRCTTFSNATTCSDIAPKCGTASSITIVGPVSAPVLAKKEPTCTTSTGCVTVTSSTTGLTFSIDGGAYTPYPKDGWCGLGSGKHCVVSKRTSDGCTSPESCVTIANQPANPDRPVVTLQDATICGTVTTPSITVSCPIVGTYKLTQTGQTDQTFSYTGSNGPVKFTVKPGIGFSITVTNSAGCTSAATDCSNYLSNVNSCPTVASAASVADVALAIQPETKLAVYPNPFNDKIRFALQPAVSGQATLDLYNMLGQKVKTVFQGRVEAGQIQNIEYSVPNAQRTNLIYIFRVGNQRISGKLLGLK